METELKLLLDPAHAPVLARSRLLIRGNGTPTLRRLLSTYYDTPDGWLQRHGAALRVREIAGEGWVQTLKGDNVTAGGLHTRDEWEIPVRGPAPDLPSLLRLTAQDADWHQLLAEPELAGRLHPLFVTDFRRTVWMVRLAQGDVVEVALDAGEVRAGDHVDPISELELELKQGRPESLFAFAQALMQDVPHGAFRIGHRSKAERGFALLHPVTSAALKAEPIALEASCPTGMGLQTILLNGLRQIDGNIDGVIDGHDPESVHQMRVGLRRLHSALRLFRDLAPLPSDIDASMAQWRHALGDARDADVFASETLPHFMRLGAHVPSLEPALQALQEAATTLAAQRRKAAADLLRAPDFTRGMLALGGWVIGMGWRDALHAVTVPAQLPHDVDAAGERPEGRLMQEAENPPLARLDERLDVRLEAPIGKFARVALRRLDRRLRQRAHDFRDLAPEDEHAARIAAKRLRYGGEFFAGLAGTSDMRRFVKRLSALQDVLGARNDARVALRLLDEIGSGTTASPQVVRAAAFVAGALAQSATRGEKRLRRDWKAFRRLPRLQLRRG